MRCTGFLRRCCSESPCFWAQNLNRSAMRINSPIILFAHFPPFHMYIRLNGNFPQVTVSLEGESRRDPARTWVEGGAASYEHTAVLLKNRLYRRWGIKSAREFARIKIEGLRLVGGHPDFTNAPTSPRFCDRQQAYVPTRGG